MRFSSYSCKHDAKQREEIYLLATATGPNCIVVARTLQRPRHFRASASPPDMRHTRCVTNICLSWLVSHYVFPIYFFSILYITYLYYNQSTD